MTKPTASKNLPVYHPSKTSWRCFCSRTDSMLTQLFGSAQRPSSARTTIVQCTCTALFDLYPRASQAALIVLCWMGMLWQMREVSCTLVKVKTAAALDLNRARHPSAISPPPTGAMFNWMQRQQGALVFAWQAAGPWALHQHEEGLNESIQQCNVSKPAELS